MAQMPTIKALATMSALVSEHNKSLYAEALESIRAKLASPTAELKVSPTNITPPSWTQTKPTTEGWYWYEDDHFGPAPVRIERTGFVNDPNASQLDIVEPEDATYLPMYDDAIGRWAGPILPPTEIQLFLSTQKRPAIG